MATSGVDAKLLKSTKFPPEFNQKVDMQKVNLQVMKKWIADKISEILGNEDDVVIELCFNLIEGSRFPDIKSLQIQLTGFLDKETAPFCKELWKLFLSAQSSPQGVPKELLEAKKLELIQEKIESDRAAEEARRRREAADRRNQDGGRDRRDWGRGRGGDSWRGGQREDRENTWRRDADRGAGRGRNRSRSPPTFRNSRNREDPRTSQRDSYVPEGRRNEGRDRGSGRPAVQEKRRSRSRSSSRGRSPSKSRSRSPPSKRRRYSSSRSPSNSPSPEPKRRRRSSYRSRSRSRGRRSSRSPSSGASSKDSRSRSSSGGRATRRRRRSRDSESRDADRRRTSESPDRRDRDEKKDHSREGKEGDRRPRRNTSSGSSA